MIINEQGTFYVEGEYAQGDTILTAGDWELRANGSKNAFAYSPETFVRRNLLNWSEDFTKSSWSKQNDCIVQRQFINGVWFNKVIANSGFSAGTGNNYSQVRQVFSQSSGFSYTLRFLAKAAEFTIAQVHLDVGGVAPLLFDLVAGTTSNPSISTITEVGDGVYLCTITATSTFTASITVRLGAVGTGDGVKGIYYSEVQIEQAATQSDYQRTITHVPRPYAIKDELVTNGTFDTDLSGWTVSFSAFWENGTLVLPRGLGVSTNAEISQVVTNLRVGCEYEVTLDIVEQIGLALHLYPFGRYVSPTYVFLGGVGTSRSVRFTANAVNMTLWLIAQGNSGDGFRVVVDNVSIKEVQQPITLGNGNHKDFRYYPKTLSQNETEALTA